MTTLQLDVTNESQDVYVVSEQVFYGDLLVGLYIQRSVSKPYFLNQFKMIINYY